MSIIVHDLEIQERIAALEDRLEHARQPGEIEALSSELYKVTGLKYAKCARCGCITTLGHRLKMSEKGPLCPGCAFARKTISSLSAFWVFGCAFLITFSVVRSANRTDVLLFLGINIAITLGFMWLLLIPHELGHAIAAYLMGGHVHELSFGKGTLLVQRRIGGVMVSLWKPSFSARCIAAFPYLTHMKLRLVVYACGGLFVHVVILGVLLPWFHLGTLGQAVDVMGALVMANVILLLANVFPLSNLPLPGVLSGARVSSDGMSIWQAIMNKDTPMTFTRRYFSIEGIYAFMAKKYASAIDIARKALVDFPGDPAFMDMLGTALLESGKHAEAIAIFKQLLDNINIGAKGNDLTPDLREAAITSIANNLACAILYDSALPSEEWQAYWYAGRAYRMMPWLATARSTWGEVLIERGRIQEGIQNLLKASQSANDMNSRASMLAHAAIGYLRMSDSINALQLLRKAKACDRENSAVRRAELAFEQTQLVGSIT